MEQHDRDVPPVETVSDQITNWTSYTPALGAASDSLTFLRFANDLADASVLTSLSDRVTSVESLRHTLLQRENATAQTGVRCACLVLADLVAQGWACRLRHGGVEIASPSTSSDAGTERDRVRAQLHVERNRQLDTPSVRSFVARMERRRFHKGRWVSIFSLMREGADLAEQLAKATKGVPEPLPAQLLHIVTPYLEIVRPDDTCEFTGLALTDIWRYFRHTWATAYRSVPGRSLMILVRDAAHPTHPVVGIAALASSAVQISVRDEWLGWAPESYIDSLSSGVSDRHVEWLLRLISDGLGEIYQDDFLDSTISPLTRKGIAAPTEPLIKWLDGYAETQRHDHQRLADGEGHKRAVADVSAWDEETWSEQAETPLFRSKRAETLAMLLRARLTLRRAGTPLRAERLQDALHDPAVRNVLKALVRRAKSERVGIAMADISVCGAIPPYTHLLGGKLVAMLLTSPELVLAYRDRYENSHSVIASSLAGRAIVRAPHLVFLGTTSLYGAEPTQYTRLSIPCGSIGGRLGESLRYALLGRTEGYGTLQFSSETADCLGTYLSQTEGGQRVHSIFGEGVSPRLRKIRDGLARLGLPAEKLLLHGSPRLVYGVALARNFREYLLGLQSEPDYFAPLPDPKETTKRIALWWAQRWLAPRLTKPHVLQSVAAHRMAYPVRHGARVVLPSAEDSQAALFDDVFRGEDSSS